MIDNETKVAFRNKLNEKVKGLIRSRIPSKINTTRIYHKYGIYLGRFHHEVYYLRITLYMKGVHFEDTMNLEASYDEITIELFMRDDEFFDKTLSDEIDDLVLTTVKKIIEMDGVLENQETKELKFEPSKSGIEYIRCPKCGLGIMREEAMSECPCCGFSEYGGQINE